MTRSFFCVARELAFGEVRFAIHPLLRFFRRHVVDIQGQFMSQYCNKWHMKHYYMFSYNSASYESTNVCLIAALSEGLSLPLTFYDVSASSLEWRARLVRRTHV